MEASGIEACQLCRLQNLSTSRTPISEARQTHQWYAPPWSCKSNPTPQRVTTTTSETRHTHHMYASPWSCNSITILHITRIRWTSTYKHASFDHYHRPIDHHLRPSSIHRPPWLLEPLNNYYRNPLIIQLMCGRSWAQTPLIPPMPVGIRLGTFYHGTASGKRRLPTNMSVFCRYDPLH